MSIEEKNKVVIRRVIDELNKGNLAIIDECFADNFVLSAPNYPGTDKEGYKQHLTRLGNAFPDGKGAIDEIVAEGDRVVFRIIITGTHKGDLLGIAPTHKTI